MTNTHSSDAKRPVAPGFDAMGDAYYRDPAAHFAEVRGESPTFFYSYLNAWIVTRREDVLEVLSDWQRFSSASNGSLIEVPEQFASTVSGQLMSRILVGSDPPGHTRARAVAQQGFLKDRMDALQPEIEARAHRIIDRFTDRGTANLLEDYCLELTTQTLLALMDLDDSFDSTVRQVRDDFFQILSSAQEPFPEPQRSEVWARYTEATLALREVIESRRESTAGDLISTMATARNRDGEYALGADQIALHLTEFCAAGTDTTAQAMANAVLFLADQPAAVHQSLDEPRLWANVFEETVRRRPSSTFASRRANVDITLGGAEIKAGDMVWLALADANTDPNHVARPLEFDIHRPDPTDLLAFTQGRHQCLGNPLARVQGATGLQVLYERLPTLRPDNPDELDFLRFALLPARRSLHVHWDAEPASQAGTEDGRPSGAGNDRGAATGTAAGQAETAPPTDGPTEAIADDLGGNVAFEVEFELSEKTVTVGADESILHAAERAGLPVISSCREGNCGTCETPILEGEANHRDAVLTDDEKESNETMMICVSRANGTCPRLILDA